VELRLAEKRGGSSGPRLKKQQPAPRPAVSLLGVLTLTPALFEGERMQSDNGTGPTPEQRFIDGMRLILDEATYLVVTQELEKATPEELKAQAADLKRRLSEDPSFAWGLAAWLELLRRFTREEVVGMLDAAARAAKRKRRGKQE
jgi:hypothetical protein